MNELYLDLAGIPMVVESEDFGDLSFLAGYVCEPAPAAYRFRARLVEELEAPTGELVSHEPAERIYRTGQENVRYFGAMHPDSTAGAYLRAVLCDGEGVLDFLKSRMPNGITGKQLHMAIDLPQLLIGHNGILLHASFIGHEGKAILFTAPSETGKSTQAQLWCDHAGAELINGDRAAVRIMDGTVFACGTPLSGSSPVRKNVMLPLAAIVFLSQAPENSIARLKGIRAFRRVWEGCTLRTWRREDVETATKTVSGIVERVPVYHLACTPDIRAVELLKHTMEVEPC